MKYLAVVLFVFFSISLSKAQTCTVTIANPTPSICLGASAVLTASGASTYSWSTGATTASISVSPTTTTVYTVTGIAGTCTQVVTTTVTIKALPNVGIAPSTATMCFGGAIVLTGSGASTYTWSTGPNTTTISVSPSVTTTYSLTGTGSNGCVKTIGRTVIVNPNVIVTNATPSICIGSSAALVASGATTYSWSTGATTASISVSPTVTTTYTVRGTTGSCSKTLSTTVYPASIPNTTVSSTSPSVCLGNSATLTASGATTYSWSTGATTTTVIVTPTVTTTYTVRGTTNGCAKTVSVTITTTALPAVVISPASPTVCNGSAIVLTGSGASTYTWNTGATTSTISVTPTVSINYTLTGTATTGCKNTAVKTVSVIALPNTTITNPTPTICAGTPVLLTGNNATTYTWNTGPTTQTISVTPTVTTNYTVTGRANGCSKTATTTVSVTALPNVSLTPTSPTVCAGSAITLTGSGATTYSWNTGAVTSTISVSPLTNTSYTVTGFGATGCFKTATKTVTVSNQIQVSTTTPTICAGSSATLTTSGSSTYSWSTGSTATSVVVSPTVGTTYTVRGTTGSCVRTLSITITVEQLPSVYISNPTPSVCLGGSVILGAYAYGALTYTWSNGATTQSISVTPTVNTTYTLTSTSDIGCTGTATATVYPVCPLNYGGIGYKVKWKNYYGTKNINDSLYRDPSVTVTEYNQSAISRNTLLSGVNGWIEEVIGSPQSVDNVVGFLDSASVFYGEFADIDFGMHIQAGSNNIYAWSAGNWHYIGPSTPGDVLRLERTGSAYIFKKNGVSSFTAAANPASNLKIKAMIYGGPVRNLGASFADSTGVYFANYVQPIVETIHTNDGTPYSMTITDGGLALSLKPGESAYTYTWAPGGANTSSILNKANGFYTVKVKDGNQNSSFYRYSINYKTKWTDLQGIELHNDTLLSNGGDYEFNTALSKNVVIRRTNGFLRWKIESINYDTQKAIGFLDNPSTDPNVFYDIADGLFQSGNELYFLTYGNLSFIGYCLPEDEMKMERIGRDIYYYRNTTLIYSQSASISEGVDWLAKVAIVRNQSTRNIGITWPAPFSCAAYNLQLTGPPIACKNNAKSFTAQTFLFTTPVSPAPVTNYVWNAVPTQIGSTISGSQNNTFNILNAPNPFVLSVSNTYGTCPLSNNFNISVSNLTAFAGPSHFISVFPTPGLSVNGAPTAIGGVVPYSYNWSISPSGLTTNPATLLSSTTNFIINPIAASFAPTVYNINLIVTDALGCTATSAISVEDIKNSKNYAILRKSLDGGYFDVTTTRNPAYGSTLNFLFEEDYGTNIFNLEYKIYKMDRTFVVSIPAQSIVYKENRYIINLTTLLTASNAFYILEVTDRKGEKTFLRFKY